MKSLRKAVVAAGLTALGLAAEAGAQTGPELILKPFPQELRLEATADAWVTETGRAIDTGESLQLAIVETQGRFRITPGEIASPRIGYAFKYFRIDSGLDALPEDLYDQSIGFATPVGQYEQWIFGLSVGVGYAGESPFGDDDAWYGRASLVAFRELDETSALAIALDYDGNRTFEPDWPLPGFAYLKRLQDNLTLTVGVPVTSVEWFPTENLRVEVSYLLVENFAARVGYTFPGGFEVFGAVGQRTDAFFVDGDQYDSDDRLLFEQRRAEVGVTYRAVQARVGDPALEFTAAVGYAFDGEFSVGYDTGDSDLIADVSDEPYARFGLQVRY